MSREWKPGDVAIAVRHDGTESRALRRWDGTWRIQDECVNNPPRDFRPLVTLDPEDREAVERLLSAYLEHGWTRAPDDAPIRTTGIDYLQAALREFANPMPPKPDEPQGLGAVVEDAEGTLWFRMSYENQTWPGEVWQEQYGDADRWSKWDSVAAVRVLSPGVEVDR